MKEEKKYPFAFSIIMSVYNVEPWIREAVDSVIKQDFDFSKVQIVFVDDGSTDNSGKICEEYREQYPDNIIVVHKGNGGLSSARNTGLKYAEGKYINFFDPDDILSRNTLGCVYSFFEKHYWETDIVSIPIYMFEAQTGEHQLNNKFKRGTRVIDLTREYSFFVASVAASFYKKEVLCGIHFDEQLLIAEDFKVNLQILLDKKTLGVVSEGRYMYRRRLSSNQSLLVSTKGKKEYYTRYLVNFINYIIDCCLDRFSCVPFFVQNALFYDLCWKYKTAHIPKNVLTEDELARFQTDIFSVLRFFDDEIIANCENCDDDLKIFLMWKKGQLLGLTKDEIALTSRWVAVHKASIILDFFTPNKNGVTIEGRLTIPTPLNGMSLYTCINGEYYPCKLKHIETEDLYSVDVFRGSRYQFTSEFLLQIGVKNYDISYHIEYLGKIYELSNVSLAKYFPIINIFKQSYFIFQNRKLTKREGVLHISSTSFYDKIKSELSFLNEIRKSKKLGYKKAIISRTLYHFLRHFKNKELWLICDKADKADDNGEALYSFIVQQKNRKIRPVFLLSNSSVDYPRMKSIGHVIPYMSKLHKFLYLFADYIISAYSHSELNRPFNEVSMFYGDITHKCKYIFLQHGVIYNSISGLNKFNKNIQGFVASSVAEKKEIITSCNYDEETVWLTGLPRFDRLYNASAKTVTIMPTWRRFLFDGFSPKDDRWALKSNFAESDFYQYYYALINDKRLISAAKRLGYKILLVPHSVFFPYLNQFEKPEYAEISGYGVSYRDIFARSSIIVTDYSSVVFDVAYLRKPILYTQFDKARFYAEHGYKQGYFDFERDGFGEVEYDLEGTVDRIIEYMENDCQLKDKYRERIDKFFAFNDQNNCQRVYEKIMALKKGE